MTEMFLWIPLLSQAPPPSEDSCQLMVSTLTEEGAELTLTVGELRLPVA